VIQTHIKVANPLVSIVIPTYNQEAAYLQQCLDSVLAQTYPNLEIIVSDNHSTNEVPNILAQYQDSRLKIVRPPEHLPITPHFHWAAEQATGEYISFLCSDDWIESECVEELVKLIHPNPNVVMAFCNAKLWIKGKAYDFVYLKNGIFPSQSEFQDYIQFKKVKGNLYGDIFRTSVYQKVGGIGSGNMTFAADKWLMIQVAAQGDVAYSEKSLAVYRIDNPLRGGRIVTYIEDTIHLYQLIEQKYLDRVAGGLAILKREKRKMGFKFLSGIEQGLTAKDIDEKQFDKALPLIKSLTDAPIIHFICRFFEKRQGIKLYSALFFFGQKMNNVFIKIEKLL
jgi:glycosyltransferase involved in cell wall biosynthesis